MIYSWATCLYYHYFFYALFNNTKKHESKDLCFSCLATSYSHRDKVPTTIGARELNFRVRYGNGCDLSAIITKL